MPLPHGPAAPVVPSNYTSGLRHYQLQGHDPTTPWWASFVGVGLALLIVIAMIVLAFII